MTWTDVRYDLENNDMVIVPLGSTEQRGPHLPLVTDCYESTGTAKMVSERTGVVVAPVLWVGTASIIPASRKPELEAGDRGAGPV